MAREDSHFEYFHYISTGPVLEIRELYVDYVEVKRVICEDEMRIIKPR